MGFGTEALIAVLGLWGVFVRPMMFRYVAEIVELMGHNIFQIIRGTRPSRVLPN
ncbi:hypothetical protein Lalb_Chr19g0134311 [Lupinus albus]|uniref:Uncharacterized protein n=1 Tax=Lupinus albus TaxID=3870 RepID=A0A6A4NV05_LUPAL|nr:hypothetical protein Lalb_Chr19g0134311 [Lupinus albus]